MGLLRILAQVVCAVVVVGTTVSDAAAQQRASGTVLDDSTRRPIQGVTLALIDANGFAVGRSASSDSLGRFVLSAPAEGRFHIRASRIGFQPVQTVPLQFRGGFEVPVEIAMSSVPQRLPLLTIAGRNIPISPMLDEFEHRRKTEHGTFFTKDDIAARNPTDVLALFRGAAGMRVVDNPDGSAAVFFLRAPTRGGESGCAPVVYLDGLKLSVNAQHAGPLEYLTRSLRVEQIHGIELYSGVSRVPAQFAGSDAQCGVVVIWTRRG